MNYDNAVTNKSTGESEVKTALPAHVPMHILQWDSKKQTTYVDLVVLDRTVRYYNLTTGYQLYEAVALSLKKLIVNSSVFSIVNGGETIPNTPDSLEDIFFLKKDLYVSFGTRGDNSLAQSWNVIWEKAIITSNLEVQATAEEEADDKYQYDVKNYTVLFTKISEQLGALGIPEASYWINQTNNLFLVYRSFSRCKTLSDYMDEVQIAYTLLSGRSVVLDVAAYFNTGEVQSDTTEMLQALRGMFDMVTSVTENATVLKIRNLFSYALVQGYLKHVGLELSEEDYSKAEMRQLLSGYSSKKGFLFAVMDTSLYVAERLDAWYRTGDFMNFLHSEKLYCDWMKEADRLLALGAFTNNLAALNNSSFKFRADLSDAIEKGRAYVKYTQKTTGLESTAIRKKLSALELLQNTEVTKRAAQAERMSPLGVLIYGSSSVGKSSFSRMLFHAYGSAFDLDRSDASCYSRNSFDPFWSGFSTSQWCVRMDDIAFLKPSKVAEVDQSIVEMLCVVNNVPYVPNQAALEDKGTTPMMAKLVIATTNSSSLHTEEYFACPLAVNRRLPYVINIKPKNEFLHDNRVFLDTDKLVCEDGKFPDFWNITVYKIVPVIGLDKIERSKLVAVKFFDNVNLFLQHFITFAFEHEENQTQSFSKNTDMVNISICKDCRMPLPHAECARVQSMNLSFVEECMVYCLTIFFSCEFLVKVVVLYMSRYRFTRYPLYLAINRLPDRQSVRMYARLNDMTRDPRFKRLIAGLTCISLGVATYVAFCSVKKVMTVVETPLESAFSDESFEEPLGVQAEDRMLENQIAKEASQNVYYQGNIKATKWDVPLASQSLAGKTDTEFKELIQNNCVAVRVRPVDVGGSTTLKGVFIVGQKLFLPAHAFKVKSNTYNVTIIKSDITSSHNNNYETVLRRGDLVIMEKSDFCMVEIQGIPPHRDILKWFMTSEFCPTSGFELTRQTDGSLDYIPFYNLHKEFGMYIESLDITADVYMGISSQRTEDGMCGSLCIGTTPRGPVIMGLHLLGLREHVGFVSVTVNQIKALMSHPTFRQYNVQGGGAPMLSCSKRSYLVNDLHHKSMFRYMEKARLNVYGTLSGFRANPKSKVCPTPVQKAIVEKYAREVAHGPPVMSGYHAVKQNVVHMVDPKDNYNKSYLKECVSAFAAEIIAGLPEVSLKELIPLSTKAAINGLPGVKFVDGINRGSSMGFPFNTSKSSFLIEDKSDEYPDGVSFIPEILADIERIEKLYAKGERAYPVFSGHNKDEAVTLQKVIDKKCRLFTGSPAGWGIVVRKKLLTFVRVMQKNSILFEAGPGVVCQSAQWGKIRDYLTKFGLDRIVAGDYGKYDKKMIADWILAAFDVIIIILKYAGWSDQELLEVQCMGFDIAFSVCNINGDLVEFFGTNPSGHPLTVIINSLVNSLYIRYCFKSLSVEASKKHFQENGLLTVTSVADFKKFVALFTYGDDNAMGVCSSIPWFNHTAIQKCLADIGVEYTMADKITESVPYIHIDQTSFLKRTWRWDEEVGGWMAPLEEDSIFKSLTMWVPSDSIDKYAQTTFVVSSAVQEYFFYGRKKFEEMREFFMELLSQEPYKHYVTGSTFPTFDVLVERFHNASQ